MERGDGREGGGVDKGSRLGRARRRVWMAVRGLERESSESDLNSEAWSGVALLQPGALGCPSGEMLMRESSLLERMFL